jgi:choice-of-anchor A domain-containing protein
VKGTSGCTGACSSSSITGTVTTSSYSPAVSVAAILQYFSCISFSLGSRTQTPTAVSYSPSGAPTTAAIALSPGISNYVNASFAGIQTVSLGGGNATSKVFINVVDSTALLAFPQTWQIPSYINYNDVIVNVLYATALSGSVFYTPVIAPLATLTADSTNVTAYSTIVVKSLSRGLTFYFSPTTTAIGANDIPCYQAD